ncbi:hypothetical protein LXM94_19180 [Rhizobium sp. TRM95111]|uniref:hypothetical protein n=1 Tax=Rhizobium alarense TaxID=2846851 RepID=UPI001F3E385D|nr:hypothetical protein [Rhizobium alarense]MCF3642095.1 hypothetical protein [Rhizobium alarense]
MRRHLAQADGRGVLSVDGDTSPVAYHLTAFETTGDGRIAVKVELKVPRDWLMERRFGAEATLLREGGHRSVVRPRKPVSLGSAISVSLETEQACRDSDALARLFPEFSGRGKQNATEPSRPPPPTEHSA